jgi:hypothetical protein
LTLSPPERQPRVAPWEDHDLVAGVTRAVRAADRQFEKEGGSSRHWVRDCFLPHLEATGLMVVDIPPPRRVTTPHDDEIVQACVSHGGHFWAKDRPDFCDRCWFHKDYPEGKIAEPSDLRKVRDEPQA